MSGWWVLEGSGAEEGRHMGRSLLASIPLRAGELTGISSRTPPCESPTMPLLAPSELRPPGTTRTAHCEAGLLKQGI